MKETRKLLLPIRHQSDFFVADIFDAIPKADQASMEHPVFSLSTKPDYRPRRYENGNNFIEVNPSIEGLATVHDKDLIIYSVSQLMAARNLGRKISKTIHIKAYDFLVATNRPTSGQAYQNLKQALIRLKGTQINTNIATNGKERFSTFGIIDRGDIIKETRDGKMVEIQITLSDWLYEAVIGTEVLTISKDYFRLRKALERRIYDIARKHCGNQPQWKINIEALQIKTGSGSSIREFRRMINKIIKDNLEKDYFPDYIPYLEVSNKVEFIVFQNRKHSLRISSDEISEELKQVVLSKLITKEEALELSQKYTSEEINNIIAAADNYVLSLKKTERVVKSRGAIFKKAFEERWNLEDSDGEIAQTFDENYEETIENESWKTVRKIFCKKYGVEVFNSWIKSLELLEAGEGTILLKAENKFASDYVKNNYLHDIEKMYSKTQNKKFRINIK